MCAHMNIRIGPLDLPPGYTDEQLLKAAARKVRCKPHCLRNLRTIRRAIDARGRAPRLIVVAEADLQGSSIPRIQGVEEAPPCIEPNVISAQTFPETRPLVVGAGPAGLMAALALAEAGARPLLIERGQAAEPRADGVDAFWRNGQLNTESNVLYGEGGAGLFSDGKLTSRSKDRPRIRKFLETLIRCGASPDILIDTEPHIGSDILVELVPALRQRIMELGGEVRFGARLDDLDIEQGALRGATVNGESLRTDICVLATGHSARDTYDMLARRGVPLEAKPFAMGVRLEIPQSRIDAAQWGRSYPELGKASFRLTRREEQGVRACYTFCMCPGGLVISCASSEGLMTTNGMSLSQRGKPMGNAAFLVPVLPEDFPVTPDGYPALRGLALQAAIEHKAFLAGGCTYALPTQRLVEFLDGSAPSTLPDSRSCTQAVPAQLRGLLPEFIEHTLRHAIPRMLGNLRGVRLDEALLYAAETRSSSPVRVLRDKTGESAIRGLYPCGEGAGYAGGIVSSGIDGLRTAEAICEAC